MERQILESFPQKLLAHIREVLQLLINRPYVKDGSNLYQALDLLEEVKLHYELLKIGEYDASKPVKHGIFYMFFHFSYINVLKIRTLLRLIRKDVFFLPLYQKLIKQIEKTQKQLENLLESHF